MNRWNVEMEAARDAAKAGMGTTLVAAMIIGGMDVVVRSSSPFRADGEAVNRRPSGPSESSRNFALNDPHGSRTRGPSGAVRQMASATT